jgi:hypothetical protein
MISKEGMSTNNNNNSTSKYMGDVLLFSSFFSSLTSYLDFHKQQQLICEKYPKMIKDELVRYTTSVCNYFNAVQQNDQACSLFFVVVEFVYPVLLVFSCCIYKTFPYLTFSLTDLLTRERRDNWLIEICFKYMSVTDVWTYVNYVNKSVGKKLIDYKMNLNFFVFLRLKLKKQARYLCVYYL